MLKDHVTLLNLLNLHGFCYPFNFFGVCCLTIVIYYMRNFCNLIALEQWYFSLI